MAACLTYLLLLLPFTIFAAAPQSLHQLYVVAPGASEVLSLRGFDIDGDKVRETFSVYRVRVWIPWVFPSQVRCCVAVSSILPTSSPPPIFPLKKNDSENIQLLLPICLY